ncbi:MAG: Wzy polymerase domain-containing protein [Gallionella sp.]
MLTPKAGKPLPDKSGMKLTQKTRQSIKLSDIKWAHVSLFLVTLMWVFPFLHYRHEIPLTAFDQEWWSAMLGVLALILLAARAFWQQPEIPRIAQLPIALIVVVMLQLALSKMAYFDQALLYILYLLFAALLMILGARLRACFGIAKLAIVLAFSLLIGAELSALIGVLQHYQWHTPLDAVVVMQISSGIYGNLAQPNHFANYIALGLISLGLLFQQHKIKSGYVILLSVPLLFVMTLSGSRSSWLYLLLMIFLAGWAARGDATLRPLLRYSALLVVGFGLMHLLVQMSFMAGANNETNTVQRLLASNGGGDTSGSIRLYLWREAWLIFRESPWLGVGFGQFAWHHFQLLPLLKANNISGLYNNAHNLIFQLAAETGIAGLLALFASMGVWFYGLRRTRPSAAHWWGYSALGVLAIHSLLEYPLWYAYFVAIAAILLGAFDETRYRLELRNIGRLSLILILVLGLISLLQLRNNYHRLKDALAIFPASANAADAFRRTRDGLIAVHGGALLAPYAELYIFLNSEVNPDHIQQKLALGTSAMRFIPTSQVVYKQAFFMAQDGQLAAAEQLIEQAIWSYPANGSAHQLLVSLAEKDPAHFSALLEFAIQKEQEHARAIHQQ